MYLVVLISKCIVEGDRGAGARENRGREGYGRREKKGREAGSLTRTGRGKEIQKGKRSLFITAYHPVKNTSPATFLTSI